MSSSSTDTGTVDVVMPQMGVSVSEGTIVAWRKQPGDWVEYEEPIVDISTDKIDTEVPSPAAGRLSEVVVEVGSTVDVGTVLAVVGDRAPDAYILDYESGAERLFDLFRGPHYTMLVFGGDAPTDRAWRDHIQSTFGRLVRVVGISRLAVSAGGDVVDESGEAHRKYGATNGALYLIRNGSAPAVEDDDE